MEITTRDFKKPKDALWSDLTGQELTFEPNYAVAAFLFTQATDTLKNSQDYDQREAALELLRELYNQELIECTHEHAEDIEMPDFLVFDIHGHMHQDSMPDELVCPVCYKCYDTRNDEWVETN